MTHRARSWLLPAPLAAAAVVVGGIAGFFLGFVAVLLWIDRLLDRLLGGGGELVTLVLGADAPPELEERLRAHVTSEWRFVELNSYAGGQPRYHLLVGVE